MTIQFHPASGEDIDVLLPLVRQYYELDKIPFDADTIRRGLADLVASSALGGAWLIREGSGTVGYFVLTFGFDLEFGGRQATLTELYIGPPRRRQGIGSAALRFVEDILRTLDIGALELQVKRDNTAALAFYERLGMHAHDRTPMSKLIPAADTRTARERRSAIAVLVDHVSLGVNDLGRSRRFYDAALAPLGLEGRETADGEIGYARRGVDPSAPDSQSFFIGFEDPGARRPVGPSAGFHIALRAGTRAEVDEFYAAALAAGGRDNGPPGVRPKYHGAYYGAFVLDPDGHHVEVVCHRSGGGASAT